MWQKIALLAVLLQLLGRPTGAQQCYVCIPRSGQSVMDVAREFNTTPSLLPLCDNFYEHSSFRRTCPETFKGCLTQMDTRTKFVTRTCANMLSDDCQEANKVRYCYCKGPLCNGAAATPAATVPTFSREPPSDDEDSLYEHSGGGPPPPELTSSQQTPAATAPQPQPVPQSPHAPSAAPRIAVINVLLFLLVSVASVTRLHQ